MFQNRPGGPRPLNPQQAQQFQQPQHQQQFQQQHQNGSPAQHGQGQEPMLKVAAVEPPMTPENQRRTKSGKWTLAQLRATDAIIPLQSGTNQFDSQRGKTGFGMPRNTQTKVEFSDDQSKRFHVEDMRSQDAIIRLQSGTNKFESQKGMTGFGMPRDVKGKHLKRIWELEFPEEAMPDQVYSPNQPYNPESAYADNGNNYQGLQSPNAQYYQNQQRH